MLQICFINAGRWEAAVAHYTAALKAARLEQPAGGRAHTAALLSNRAAALLRSGQPLLVRAPAKWLLLPLLVGRGLPGWQPIGHNVMTDRYQWMLPDDVEKVHSHLAGSSGCGECCSAGAALAQAAVPLGSGGHRLCAPHRKSRSTDTLCSHVIHRNVSACDTDGLFPASKQYVLVNVQCHLDRPSQTAKCTGSQALAAAQDWGGAARRARQGEALAAGRHGR